MQDKDLDNIELISEYKHLQNVNLQVLRLRHLCICTISSNVHVCITMCPFMTPKRMPCVSIHMFIKVSLFVYLTFVCVCVRARACVCMCVCVWCVCMLRVCLCIWYIFCEWMPSIFFIYSHLVLPLDHTHQMMAFKICSSLVLGAFGFLVQSLDALSASQQIAFCFVYTRTYQKLLVEII